MGRTAYSSAQDVFFVVIRGHSWSFVFKKISVLSVLSGDTNSSWSFVVIRVQKKISVLSVLSGDTNSSWSFVVIRGHSCSKKISVLSVLSGDTNSSWLFVVIRVQEEKKFWIISANFFPKHTPQPIDFQPLGISPKIVAHNLQSLTMPLKVSGPSRIFVKNQQCRLRAISNTDSSWSAMQAPRRQQQKK